jgi:pimeloyl-ACP methyl ester carboxylesterase
VTKRFAYVTGCERFTIEHVPLARGSAEVLRLEPVGAPRGYVLAVHGFGVNQIFPNAPLYKLFLQAGLGVLAVPLPGHHPLAPPLHSPWLDDYLPTISDRLQPVLDAPIVMGFGNSMGAALTLASLVELPQIRHGVFLQPPLWVDLTSAELALEVATSFGRDLLKALDVPMGAMFSMALARCRFLDRDGRERLRNFLHPAALPAVQRVLDHLNLPHRLSTLNDHRFLLVTGEKDRVAPPYDVARLAGFIPSSPQVAVVPNANHTTLFFVPKTLQLVRDWLDEHFPSDVIHVPRPQTADVHLTL